LILITTDKCYKNSNSKKIKFFNESSELGGGDPYSSSKACAEIAIHAYQNIFFKNKKVKISSARAGNIIGGGDWAKDRLVPDIYRSLHSKKVLKIRYLNATRPWQHVLDVINGYLLLAQSNYSGAWNFGPSLKKTFKVKDILLNIKRRNPKLIWKILKPKEIQESINLNLDIKKAKKILKWQPKWKIKKTLEETNKWYENFYNKKDINYLTIKQIKDFFKL
ncbi:GDP-mannose 4,6-dehydratase, partial [Candidatus Pelagibacter communis]|uniref:GDP-mannose 4,6-dehydratase n=1 Tax=Pelagibacter ubique TaxID=198252 RepID=UPI000A7EC917